MPRPGHRRRPWPPRQARPLVGAVVALWAAAGCGAAVIQVEPAPAPVTLVPWNDTTRTLEALARKPYLTVKEHDAVKALSATAGQVDPGKRAQEAAREVRATLARARELYRKLAFDQAVSALRKARKSLGIHATSPAHYALLSELALQLGLNHLALKDEPAARRAIITASLHGYKGPAPGALPPEAESFIAAVRRGMAGQTPGSISIDTRPPGARVLINGKQAGVSPVTVQVPAGMHHLRVVCPGFQSSTFFQQVAAGKVERAEFFLQAAGAALAARQLLQIHGHGAAPSTFAGDLGKLLGTNRGVLWNGGAADAPYLQLRWIGGKPSQGTSKRCSGDPATRADCLGPALYQLATGKPYAKKTIRTPIYKRWWFWAIIGGSLAAATGTTLGIYYGTRPSDRTDVDLEYSRK